MQLVRVATMVGRVAMAKEVGEAQFVGVVMAVS